VIFQQIGQAIFFIEFYDFSVFLYPYRMYRVLFILFCSTFALTHTAHHITDHDDAGAGQAFPGDGGLQLAQCADCMALRGQAGVVHDGHGGGVGQAVQQFVLDVGGTAHTHVNHQSQLGLEGRVIKISPIAETVGGDVVYPVMIELSDQPDGLLWGMTAEVQIQTK